MLLARHILSGKEVGGRKLVKIKAHNKVRVIFILCLFLFAFSPFVGGASSKSLKEISPDMIEAAKNELKGFQKPLPPEMFRSIIDRAEEAVSQELGIDTSKGIYSEGDTIFYFFSFSMPAPLIKEALLDIARINREQRGNVVMVLRGFVNNDLKSTIRSFYELMKEAKIDSDLPVEINPELFDKYSVVEVPTMVQELKGNIAIMKGAVSPSYAMSRFDKKLKDYGKYGITYPIKEENILKVIEARQKLVEEKLRERIKQIKSRMYVLKKYDGKFKHAEKDRVYHIDPSVVLTADIVDHTGRVLFAKGSRFNPSDYISLGRYIIIDGRDPKQVEFALNGNFRKIILISGDLVELTKKYRKKFYFANDLIINRLNIQNVPSIVEQEGRYIRVTEKAISKD